MLPLKKSKLLLRIIENIENVNKPSNPIGRSGVLVICMEIPRCLSLRYFVLTVQPFGLSSAPYIFTECLKPLETYRKVNGVNIALLLDDGWLIDIDRNPVQS